MANRDTGSFNFSQNFEVLKSAPFDARLTTPEYSQLGDGSIPNMYQGMIVAVTSDTDTSLNGAYLKTGAGDSTSDWTKFGVGDVANISGSTYITIDTTSTPGTSIIEANATDSYTDTATDASKLVARNTDGRAFAADPPSTSDDQTLATTSWVNDQQFNTLTLVGGFNASTGALESPLSGDLYTNVAITKDEYYVVTTAGDFFGNASTPLSPGDYVIVQTTKTAGNALEGDFLIIDIATNPATSGTIGLATVTAGTGISTSFDTGDITVTNTDLGSSQNIFKTIASTSQTSVTAATNTETLNIEGSDGISITTNNTSKTITISGSGTIPSTNVTTTTNGTNNTLAIFTGDHTIANSTITFNGGLGSFGAFTTGSSFTCLNLTATSSITCEGLEVNSNDVIIGALADSSEFQVNYAANFNNGVVFNQNSAGTSSVIFNSPARFNGTVLDSTGSPGVSGSILSTNGAIVQWIPAPSGGSGTVTGSGTATQVAFWKTSSELDSSTGLYWDDANGRLGIGTTIPSETLEVANSSSASINIKSTTGACNIDFSSDTTASAGAISYSHGTNSMTFKTNSINVAFFNSDGDLALFNKLTVDDTAVFSNDITVSEKLFDGVGNMGTAGQILSSDGGQVEWIDAPTGTIGGSGAENKIAKFSAGGTSIENSNIEDNGTSISIGTNTSVTGKVTSTATVGGDPDTTLTTKGYVDGVAAGGLTFKGTFNATTGEILDGSNVNQYLYNCPGGEGTRIAVAVGDYYAVATAGSFYCSGTSLFVGDSVIGVATASADSSTEANWSIVQSEQGVTALTSSTSTTPSSGNAITANTNATGSVSIESFPYKGQSNVGHVPEGGSNTTFLRGDGTWVNPNSGVVKNITTSGGLDDSTNVGIQDIFLKNNTNFTDGQILKWNSTNSQLENSAISQNASGNINVSESIKAKGGQFTSDVTLTDSQGNASDPAGDSSAVNRQYVQSLTSNFVSGTTAGSPNTAVTEIRTLTQAQYDALVSAGTVQTDVMYVIIG